MLSNLSKQITNKYVCGYQLVSLGIYTIPISTKVPLQYTFPLMYRMALIYLALLWKNITLIISELLYTAIHLTHNFLFTYTGECGMWNVLNIWVAC